MNHPLFLNLCGDSHDKNKNLYIETKKEEPVGSSFFITGLIFCHYFIVQLIRKPH